MNPLTQSKNTTILPVLSALTLACFALEPQARAVCQEGCDTNSNTFLGEDALSSNTTGFGNTAIGFEALFSNTIGTHNTATGEATLHNNTTGGGNTANGYQALQDNTIGVNNTADGFKTLESNTTGNHNTAIGLNALSSNRFGSSNIAVGILAGASIRGSNNIDIGNLGKRSDSNTIRIGTQETQTATFIAGISGATVPTGVAVIVDANGHLGTTTSSARFKDEIKPMDKASETILALKPVTFHYKQELDPEGIPQFGLVAEEVEKVNPALVARDDDGKPYTVRYEAVNAMLLNEFLKEHRKVEEQQATIAQLKAADAKQEEKISALTALVKAQAAQIQKVSAQLEVNKTASQIVLNNQ
jgi:Chaperone of endosialidase